MKWKYALILFTALLLSACSQNVELYFYADESWKASSDVAMTGYETIILKYLEEYLEEWGAPIETSDLANGLTNGALETLRAQYAAVGIDFQWSGAGASRSFIARGRSLEQFNKLLPGALSVSKESEDRYRLRAEFGEVMPFLAAFYQLDISLHGEKIYESDAYRQRGGVAQWRNPPRMNAVFAPDVPFPWGWLLTALFVVLLVAVFGAISANRKKCPNCGKRISKKAEYCPHCGEGMGYVEGGWR